MEWFGLEKTLRPFGSNSPAVDQDTLYQTKFPKAPSCYGFGKVSPSELGTPTDVAVYLYILLCMEITS